MYIHYFRNILTLFLPNFCSFSAVHCDFAHTNQMNCLQVLFLYYTLSVLTNVPQLFAICRGPICFCISQVHLVLYLSKHHVCYFCLEDPNLSLCSLMHLVCMPVWRIPACFVLTNVPRLLCLSGGSKSVFLCSLMYHVWPCLLGGFQIWFYLSSSWIYQSYI